MTAHLLPIRFEHGGIVYEVGRRVLEDKLPHIVLPDGTLLKIEKWSRTLSPVPTLVEAPHLFRHLPADQIAALHNGIVAKKVE